MTFGEHEWKSTAYGTKKNIFNRVEKETSIEIHAECKTAKNTSAQHNWLN